MTLFDDLKSPVGIGFYHPNQKEAEFMAELQSCLSKESGFKKITQDMLTPPLIIDTFYERSSYFEWNVWLTSVFFGLIFIGLGIEMYKYVVSRRKKQTKATPMVENQHVDLKVLTKPISTV